MAINMGGNIYDSADEFFEMMDGMYERGMADIEDMPYPDKYRQYLADKKAEITYEIGEDSAHLFKYLVEEETPKVSEGDAVKGVDENGVHADTIETSKFKSGDKVRIVGNGTLAPTNDSILHHYEYGDVGVVENPDRDGDIIVTIKGSAHSPQFVSPEHLELVEESETEQPKFNVGDKVRLTDNRKPMTVFSEVGTVGTVVRSWPNNERLKVEIKNISFSDTQLVETAQLELVKPIDEEDVESEKQPKFNDGDIVMVNEEFTDEVGDTSEKGVDEVSKPIFMRYPYLKGTEENDGASIEGNEDKLTLVCRVDERLDK